MRVRIDLAYDGAPFVGWARQPGQWSAQAIVEAALSVMVQRRVAVTVAGRTDAGVHARGQVAHVDFTEDEWARLLEQTHGGGAAQVTARLNSVIGLLLAGRLPADRIPDAALALEVPTRIGEQTPGGEGRRRASLLGALSVRALTEVREDFDARFSALSRTYTYTVCDSREEWDPLRRGFELWVDTPLDVDAMQAAAAHALGLRNFLAFCKPREGASTVRELQALSVARSDARVTFTVQADAFCHHMVRSLVGGLLKVGAGERSGEWFADLLDSPRREGEVVMAAPHPLVLESVEYPDESLWALRAEQTRAKRT